MPELRLYTGPMFSGKTSSLLIEATIAAGDGRNAVLLKPSADLRHHGELVSHDGRRHAAVAISDPDDLRSLAAGADTVIVDEAQFLEVAFAAALHDIVRGGRDVVAAGLNEDFRGDPFETVAALIRIATDHVSLAATCGRCGRPATKTQRLIDGCPAPWDAPRILIGGADVYAPRCTPCWTAERR